MSQQRRFRDLKQKRERLESSKPKSKSKKTEAQYRYASIGMKSKAFITDLFMISTPIMYLVVYLVMDGLKDFSQHKVEGWLAILIPNFIIIFLFFWKAGQTPGCRAYGIKLVDSKTGGEPHPLAIGLRYYFELLSIVSIVGLALAYFRGDRRTLHDLLSGTHLIDVDDKL